MEKSFKDMAQRLVNAEKRFIDSVVEQFGFSKEDAAKALFIYKKHKIVKLDPVDGSFKIKAGVFWEADVIKNAIDEYNEKFK